MSSKSPSTSEIDVGEKILGSIRSCAQSMFERLELDAAASTTVIVEAVNAEITRQQAEGAEPPEGPRDTEPLCLGSLWGEQLVAELQWEWVQLTFHEHGDSQAFGLASPDRAWIICPFHYVFGCLANDVIPTVSLSFSMIEDGTRLPEMPAGGYENLMAGVRHIIPPR